MFRRMIVFVLVALFAMPSEVAAQTKATVFVPSHRVQGVGRDRESVAAIGLDIRTSLAERAQWFWIMKRPEARAAPKRIFESKLWRIIESSAKAKGLDPIFLASRIFLESWGDCAARASERNWAAAAGCAQFTASGAKDEGLVIKRERKKVGKLWLNVVVRDDRLDPILAIPAMANRIARRSAVYGRSDFEVAEYHMGAGNMLSVLSLYTGEKVDSKNAAEIIRRKKLTYPLVFFNNTARYKKDLYSYFGRLADYSPTYYFRIQAAYDLLKIYRQQQGSYAAILEQFRPKFDDKEESPNRMWSYYGQADVKRFSILNLDQLKTEWKHGRIVPMPNQPDRFGVRIRTSGESPIAEKDPANRQWYLGSEPATLGCLLYLAYELRQFESMAFRPLETNSLVRDVMYQAKLSRGNSVARTELPTHVMAKGFDLPRKVMSAGQLADLTFLLKDLESLGLISWIQEGAAGQMAFHIVPDPAYTTFFADIYKDAQALMR